MVVHQESDCYLSIRIYFLFPTYKCSIKFAQVLIKEDIKGLILVKIIIILCTWRLQIL